MSEEKNNKRELLLQEARNEDLIRAIKSLPSLLPKVDNSQVAKAIEANTKEIGNFGKALAALEVKVEAPHVNVQTDLSEVSNGISELKSCQERIENLLIKQNEYFAEMCKPKDYEFEFQRNQWGVMQSPIKAKSKSNYKN